MKKLPLVLLGVIISCMLLPLKEARAVSFTISNIGFTELIGNNENLTWSVSAIGGASFNLSVGQSKDFTYGYFSTSDFGGGLFETLYDLADNNDSFRASFQIQPPSPAANASRVGSPDMVFNWCSTYVSVDFNNSATNIAFADSNGAGTYAVSFLDSGRLYSNGSIALEARLTLLSYAGEQATAPVPEPGTMLLMGGGLLGLAALRRFKR